MAKSNAGMLIGATLVVGTLYFVMSRKASAAPAITPAGTGGPISSPAWSPGSMATTTGALSATNAIWANLTPTTGPYAGFVNFPTGSQAPAGVLQWAADGSGNYYVQWAGHIYLVPLLTDSQGNFTAGQLIS